MKQLLKMISFMCLLSGPAHAVDNLEDHAALDLIKSEKVEDLDASVQEQLRAIGHKSKTAEKMDPGTTVVAAVSKIGTKEQIPESEIPVLSEKKAGHTTGTDAISNRLILSFTLVFGLLAGGLLFLRRYMQKNREKSKHTQIKVLTQHFLGPKKSLAIIRVAGESVLIGITDHSISLIKQLHMLDEELQEDEIQRDETQRGETQDFRRSLKGKQNPSSEETWAEEESEPAEEFAMKNIRDVISRGMRKSRFY